MTPRAPSVVSSLFPWVICDRRWAECESPRRRDAGTSWRSGDEADGPPPPQSTHGNKLDTTLEPLLPHRTPARIRRRWRRRRLEHHIRERLARHRAAVVDHGQLYT